MSKMNRSRGKKGRWIGPVIVAGLMLAVSSVASAAEPTSKEKSVEGKTGDTISGREIFLREWLPNDPRSHGGDGLGPVFNDSSCVACHNQGGPGGGGAASKNVNIVSATFNQPLRGMVQPRPSVATQLLRAVLGLNQQPQPRAHELTKEELTKERKKLVEEVTNIHPGFRTANSVVIHHFGTKENYENWKSRLLSSNQDVFFQDGGMQVVHTHESFAMPAEAVMEKEAVAFEQAEEPAEQAVRATAEFNSSNLNQGRSRLHRVKSQVRPVVFSTANQRGHFALAQSQRNATALFGAGLIDAIPDRVLEAAAKKTYKDYPEVSGRVAKLPDGKIGRYGWKAQKATLRDFTVTACAVELGLHVPEHPQSGDPNKPAYQPTGFDLTKKECDSLVDYLRNLPAPEMRKANHPAEKKYLKEGQALFASVGCANCHTQDLGEAKGIYSDLLLHDMGPELGDTGDYGVFLPDSPGGDDGSPVPPITELTQPINHGHQHGVFEEIGAKPKAEAKQVVGATNLEWRTPPLWGVRDSAPYLHDGRANTLEQAVAMHGGEGSKSALHFFSLKPEDRQKVVFFLKSLEAPSERLAER